mgnify:FL=1
MGLRVAKTIKFSKLPVKFQLSAEKSEERQGDFGMDWKIRLNVIPVIPALVKNPLFQLRRCVTLILGLHDMEAKRPTLLLMVCGLLLATQLPRTAEAGALYFYEMSSASESGYAGAGMVARANDAGTAFSNPGGMTRFKSPVLLAGATGVYINAGFRSGPGTTAEGREKGINKRVVPAGSFAYVRPVSDRISLGISAHNYFGLALDWKDDWIGRESAVNITLIAPQLQPTVAYRVNDWLSVGAGAALTLGYMKDKLRVEDPFNPGGRDGKLRLSDTDFAVQGNFGVMLQPTGDMRIGIRYLTETDLKFRDSPDVSGVRFPDLPNVDITTPAKGLDLDITMPQAVDVAIHYQWNDKLALLGSVGWEEFSEFGRVQVGIDNTGITTTKDADFRDVWGFGVGVEYRYRPDLELTAGFTYNTSMSTDRTRPIVIPLGSMYRYAVGFKHERRDGLTLGGGLTWIWEGNLPVKDAGGINNGQYNNAWIAIPSLYAKWEF